MTDEQRARLPALLRDIVDHDRDTRLADNLARYVVQPIEAGHDVRQRRALRAEMSAGARHLYGRAPLRGDTGPGRPTAVAA